MACDIRPGCCDDPRVLGGGGKGISPIYLTWAAFAASFAAPDATTVGEFVYVTDAGKESLWICSQTGAATYAWLVLWSAWYGATGSLPPAIAAYAGLRYFDTSLAMWVTCVETSGGGYTWIADGSTRHARKTAAPGVQPYPDATITTVASYSSPTALGAFILGWWQIPPVNTGVSPGIRFTFVTDAGVSSTIARYNTGAGVLVEQANAIDWNVDGQRCTRVEFIADNHTGGALNLDLGTWLYNGEVIR